MEEYSEVFDETLLEKEGDVTLRKSRRRAWRRKKDVAKAFRKYHISKAVFPITGPWYGENIHRYSKNKIHCSCPMCAFHGTTMQDKRRLDEMAFEKATYEDELLDREYEDDEEYPEWIPGELEL
jgi:hypothetical protein